MRLYAGGARFLLTCAGFCVKISKTYKIAKSCAKANALTLSVYMEDAMKLNKPDSNSLQAFLFFLGLLSLVLSIICAIYMVVIIRPVPILYAILCVFGGVVLFFLWLYLRTILAYLDFQSSVQAEIHNKFDAVLRSQNDSQNNDTMSEKQTTNAYFRSQNYDTAPKKASVKTVSKKVCPECGMDISVKDEHCTYCGALIPKNK